MLSQETMTISWKYKDTKLTAAENIPKGNKNKEIVCRLPTNHGLPNAETVKNIELESQKNG